MNYSAPGARGIIKAAKVFYVLSVILGAFSILSGIADYLNQGYYVGIGIVSILAGYILNEVSANIASINQSLYDIRRFKKIEYEEREEAKEGLTV